MTAEPSIPDEAPEPVAEAALRETLERAFDYRGDVTITRRDGAQVEGYVFDRRVGATLAESAVRVVLTHGGDRITIPYSDIAALRFTGRDAAAGSFRPSGARAVERCEERAA